MIRLALALLMLPLAAAAQEHNHTSHRFEDLDLHVRYYRTWMRPDMPQYSCCNEQDCAPARVRKTARGFEFHREDDPDPDNWVLMPPEKIENFRADQENARDAPDGRSHACYTPGSNFPLCAVIGNGM